MTSKMTLVVFAISGCPDSHELFRACDVDDSLNNQARTISVISVPFVYSIKSKAISTYFF